MEFKNKNTFPKDSQKDNTPKLSIFRKENVRLAITKSGSYMRRDRRNSKFKKKSSNIEGSSA